MKSVRSLWVVWQDPENHLYYHVGTLSYFDNHYEFSYTLAKDELLKLSEAQSNGYMLHPAFPDSNKNYKSDQLFSAFNRRLPSSDRQDFSAILRDLGLDKNCSKMDILEATRGRLANDTYSFERPLRLECDNKVRTSFYIHGMRHSQLPENWPTWLRVGDTVKLKHEKENPVDPNNAVGVFTHNGKRLGYVPRFYSKAITAILAADIEPHVNVCYINEKSTPGWWVKLQFESDILFDKTDLSKELEASLELAR